MTGAHEMRKTPDLQTCTPTTIKRVLIAGVSAFAIVASAQDFKDVRAPQTPLVLKARGSFYVGGEKAQQTKLELGNLGPDDTISINQMYVEYMVGRGSAKTPLVLVHGATLSGKTYDTTPDGRMGWFEYFVRKGHPTYVVDQVGRARSGFNQAVFNNVRAGGAPPASQPTILRLADASGSWTNFRFGPSPGVPFADSQFPLEAAHELSKQSIPDLNAGLPAPNPSFSALSELAGKLERPVLIGHSQGARIPTPTALIDPQRFSGLILIEPGNCTKPTGPQLSDEQIVKLATVPILVVFGDHLDMPTGLPLPTWQDNFNDCQAFISRVKAAGGNAQMLHPPQLGIKGNSHMLMQDKNNLRIADLLIGWIDKNTRDARKAR
jgi:pimeloyl-ACP methyl ester carboxylesterase